MSNSEAFLNSQDIEDLDHYEMKEEEPVDGKKSEDDGIEKENLAILEKIRKNQRQDHLNVSLGSVSFEFWDKMKPPFKAHKFVKDKRENILKKMAVKKPVIRYSFIHLTMVDETCFLMSSYFLVSALHRHINFYEKICFNSG